jgi:hypothetical protein
VTASPLHWRTYAARVSAILSTPLPAVLTMEWCDMLLWFEEAKRIDRETWGLWRVEQ